MAPPDRSCPRCAAPLSGGARFCPACGLAVARLSTGQILDGKYEILDKIGEGGMGEVYRARHLHLDEIRIIKVTKPDAAGDGAPARRFQEEARLATLVRHPNVAALYDFSRQADGSFYMVWEFIDGVTLEAWLRRRGALPPDRALDVARQVLAGLSEIHAQGIIHRDLSPDNIMLRETPGGGIRAKIIDLGIAKRVAADTLPMTGTGLFLGKLKYCSPEQAGSLPAGEPIDARSDIYSFGAVLYEMLSGKAPFESSTPEGYIGKHLHSAAPPLDVSGLPEAVGSRLAAIVARTLEKKRERRYASARELSDALAGLERALASAPKAPAVVAGREPEGRGLRIAAVLGTAVIVAVAAFLLRRSFVPKGRPAEVPARAAQTPASSASSVSPRPMPAEAAAAPTAVPPAAAGASAGTPSLPEQTGAAVPTPPPPPASAATPGRSGAPPPAEALRLIAHWKTLPPEARAKRAQEVARRANLVAAAYPDDPGTAEIRATLPAFLKSQSLSSLDRAEPLAALLYFRAYRVLDFAPADPELERRLERFRPAEASRERPLRTPPPGPDGR